MGILDLLPRHDWESQPLWAVAPRVKEFGRPELQPLSVFLGAGVVPRSERDDNHNSLGEDLAKYLVVRPGDLVFNKLRTWQGGLGVSQFTGIVSPAYYVCRPGSKAYPRFLHYLLLSKPYLAELTRLSKWMPPSQFDIPWDQLRRLPVVLPSFHEQRRIADFLDVETARIDRASRLMAHEIETLEARRSSLLGELMSVSRGDSVRLGYRTTLVTSGPRGWSEYIGDEGVLFFRSANLQRNRIEPNLSSLARVAPPAGVAAEATRSRVRFGDVLIGITGANTGWITLADESVEGANVSQHVCLVRPSRDMHPAWLAYFLSSPIVQEFLLGNQYGGTKTQLSLPDIRGIHVPLIPYNDQSRIANEMTRALSRLRQLSDLRRTQMRVLAERRQALITAAVTGQFDVTTARGADLS